MAKFKVGDRVMVRMIGSPLWCKYYGASWRNGVIASASADHGYRVKLTTKNTDDDGVWCPDESELSPILPVIPPGWTPASEPPDGGRYARNVRVLLNDGREWYGWYNGVLNEWFVFSRNVDATEIVTNWEYMGNSNTGEVIAWREIEPKPAAKVRYAIVSKDEDEDTELYDDDLFLTYDAAEDAARKCARESGKSFEVWKLVAIVNPPAEPEVIRMEE